MERLRIVPLSECEPADVLGEFRVAGAHCFDLNNELRLRALVGALGQTHFEERIHSIAVHLCDKEERAKVMEGIYVAARRLTRTSRASKARPSQASHRWSLQSDEVLDENGLEVQDGFEVA